VTDTRTFASTTAELLAEIERSGSGSERFWVRLFLSIDALTDAELKRVLLAAGDRAAPVRARLAGTTPLPMARSIDVD
jgi:hypothetical protein